jgi:hypothetical protein
MRPILLCVAFVGALISPAFAHTGAGETNSFISGIAHPLNGTDHILAMVALGLWAVLAGGRAIWIWPNVGGLCSSDVGHADAPRGSGHLVVDHHSGAVDRARGQGPGLAGRNGRGTFRLLSWPRPRDRGRSGESCSLCRGFCSGDRRSAFSRHRAWAFRRRLDRQGRLTCHGRTCSIGRTNFDLKLT